ncbi:MAG: hypothetical protein HY852_04455 [Bradyrhizobium sp.]|uniref:hypothetical protein n=1 Tax=Bradyrhizobium sp. TaxID=376 RepID=UPI0025BD17CB|nr:hypothetical protein [Bradyrhizobium sp.]MBI5261052.1 hypothetical protein [Bradyrhizobium sp.]
MSSVIQSRSTALWLAAAAAVFLLQPSCAQAQWWKRAPADFEECAEAAEKAASKQEKTAALAECNAKFAGRRKPGGGYTYYDFLQDRTFDIAGPNPTPEEQKKIDEQYAVYLAKERQNNIAAEAAAKQHQEQLHRVSLRTEPERVPVPPGRRAKPQAATPQTATQTTTLDTRPRPKPGCAKNSFSCNWPRLSEGLNDLKKLFSSSSSKAKKG